MALIEKMMRRRRSCLSLIKTKTKLTLLLHKKNSEIQNRMLKNARNLEENVIQLEQR